MEKYSLTISDTDKNLYLFPVQEANAQNSESKEEAMDQGTSQEEQNAEKDENVENEVSYFLLFLFQANISL